MNKSILIRIIIDIVLFISIIKGWWFIAFPLIIFSVWLLPFFIESIIAGIVYDSLFGLISGLGIWSYTGTIFSVFTFFIIINFKDKFR